MPKLERLWPRLLAALLVGLMLYSWYMRWLEWDDESRRVMVVMLIMLGVPLCAVVAFAILVWPTKWRYDRADGHLVRVGRFTGHAEILTPRGWARLGENEDHFLS